LEKRKEDFFSGCLDDSNEFNPTATMDFVLNFVQDSSSFGPSCRFKSTKNVFECMRVCTARAQDILKIIITCAEALGAFKCPFSCCSGLKTKGSGEKKKVILSTKNGGEQNGWQEQSETEKNRL
jgi:hypothetical protein